jgi:PEGA domain-containing protein/sigma-54-interacting transcriptional regulator
MTDTCRGRHADMNADWEAAVAWRLPTLLTGPRSTTENLLHYVQRRLARPVIEVACDVGVKTSGLDDAGTVVLQDVEHLRPADQRRLLRWLEKAPQRPQIISTSSRPLYPLVGAGRFSETLYYRLNSVHLDCTNPTIIDLGADEGGWIGEFYPEEPAQAPGRPAVPSVLPAVLSSARTRLAVTSCALGVVIGAVSMWVMTAQSQSAVVPVASSARIQDSREHPALLPVQYDVPAATLQGSSGRGAPFPRATTLNQTEPVAPAPTVLRVAAQPRRTVFRGALAVNSRPAGARVSINGQSLGVTPLTVSRLPAGSRVVRVTAQGYHPWSSAVRIVANQRNSVMATLQQLPGD